MKVEYERLDPEAQAMDAKAQHGQRLRRVSRAALVVLCGMSLSFFILYLSNIGGPVSHTPQLSLEELRNGTYAVHAQPISWIPDGANGQVLIRKSGGFEALEWDHKETAKHICGLNFTANGKSHAVVSVKLNKQQTHALVFTNRTKNWRHSSFSDVYVLDISTQNADLVCLHASVAEWSPDGRNIAYVVDRNVYLHDISQSKSTQVSFDGGASVFNGIPDWVYEEEVFSGASALWWSASGRRLAFLRTNDSLVPEFPIPYFVQSKQVSQYPDLVELKYPKPGTPNPQVEMYVFNNGQAAKMELKSSLFQPIIFEALWVGETLVTKVMDRESDHMEVWVADFNDDGQAKLQRKYKSSGSWFEVTHNSHAVGDEGYVDTIDHEGYNHLGFFSPANASEPILLTSGDWEVDDAPIAVNVETRHAYFTGTKLSSRQSTFMRVALDNPKEPELVAYQGPGVYQVDFSGDASFATVYYTGPETPLVQKIVSLNSSKEWVVADNKPLKELVETRKLGPSVTYGQVELSDGISVNYREIRPSKFNARHKHPLLFFNYGGPGSQQVQERLLLDFQRVYAETHNAVVVTVDPRGTGKRGRKFREVVRDNLGIHEADDIIEVAKLWNKKSYINQAHTAIWGWSYGGYLTLKTLERDVDLAFQYGVAVAPVTDWSLYDSIYTERYMHTPQNNPDGYANSAIHNVTNLARHKRFMIMHGTGDDNVHFQNTLALLDRLDVAGVENYDVHVFPDSDHSISYHGANRVLYDKLDTWLTEMTS